MENSNLISIPELQININNNEFLYLSWRFSVIEGSYEEQVVGVFVVGDVNHCVVVFHKESSLRMMIAIMFLHVVDIFPIFLSYGGKTDKLKD